MTTTRPTVGDQVRVQYIGVPLRNTTDAVGEVTHVSSFESSVVVTVDVDRSVHLIVTLRVSGENSVERRVRGGSKSYVGNCVSIDVVEDNENRFFC